MKVTAAILIVVALVVLFGCYEALRWAHILGELN